MERCDFSDARLDRTEFLGTVLIDCKFEGDLREVIFYGDWDEGFAPNEMLRVDLRRARLHMTEFRRMDMPNVRWPEDAVLIDNYHETLDRVLAGLAQSDDPGASRLATVLPSRRKWAGPNQQRGVVSKEDLIKLYGPNGVEVFLRLARGRHS